MTVPARLRNILIRPTSCIRTVRKLGLRNSGSINANGGLGPRSAVTLSSRAVDTPAKMPRR